MDVVIQGLEFSYSDKVILDGVDMKFKEGKITGIIGSGKTTLIKVLSGDLRLKRGKITIGDIVISQRKRIENIIEYRKISAMVSSFPSEETIYDTVEKELMFIIEKYHYENIDFASLLDKVGLDSSYLSRDPFSLSNSEIRKLGLAKALIHNPDVLLLDEPFVGLDVLGRKKLNTLLTSLKVRDKKTIIIASNDINSINEFVDEVVVIKEGKVIKSGDKKEIFKDILFLKKNDIEIPNIMKFVDVSLKEHKQNLPYRYEVNDLVKDILRKLDC